MGFRWVRSVIPALLSPLFPLFLCYSREGGNPARRPAFRVVMNDGRSCVTRDGLDPRLRGGDEKGPGVTK